MNENTTTTRHTVKTVVSFAGRPSTVAMLAGISKLIELARCSVDNAEVSTHADTLATITFSVQASSLDIAEGAVRHRCGSGCTAWTYKALGIASITVGGITVKPTVALA